MIAQLTSRLPLLRVCALVLAALAPRLACAEDIDLYAGTGGASAAPNVLFFLDNSSNWSAASQAWHKNDAQAKCAAKYAAGSPQQTLCQNYVTQIFGLDSTLKQGQVELRALRLVLTNLVCRSTAKLKLNTGHQFGDGIDAKLGV